jgi:acyl-CoA hydrolase
VLAVQKNTLRGKPVNASAIEKYPYIVFPEDLNGNDEAFGGFIFSLADRLAGTVFRMHAECLGTTAAFDEGEFLAPVKKGDLLVLKAAVNRVWSTSCEIGVKAFVATHVEGEERYIPVTRMYFTYVSRAFDAGGTRKQLPAVIPETPEQKKRFYDAAKRRRVRLARKQRRLSKAPS